MINLVYKKYIFSSFSHLNENFLWRNNYFKKIEKIPGVSFIVCDSVYLGKILRSKFDFFGEIYGLLMGDYGIL